MIPHPSERATGVKTAWTPQKLDKAWRIFNGALPVMAAGVGVPADELRAFLIDGAKPKMQTLQDRIIQCHIDNPTWSAKDVAEELDSSPDTVRGLASRAGITWPKVVAPITAAPKARPVAPPDYQKADVETLAQHGKNARFRLRDEHGEYLHMAVANNLRTRELIYAWRGTRDQLRAVRAKYDFARGFDIVVVAA